MIAAIASKSTVISKTYRLATDSNLKGYGVGKVIIFARRDAPF
ncbi:hypothetical protein SAMN07250955_10417 [Arboricoccus pini]|uniref:Uncharacterized protein n=1 Tax=Arboricoccus pini TaxID=1963835 RepID=A0A212QWE7_9PROT|nr:hypothetical protein SAMN07250955_10417 [Arboricoccus pini]